MGGDCWQRCSDNLGMTALLANINVPAFNHVPERDGGDLRKFSCVCTGTEILLPGWGLPFKPEGKVGALQEEEEGRGWGLWPLSQGRYKVGWFHWYYINLWSLTASGWWWITLLEAQVANVAEKDRIKLLILTVLPFIPLGLRMHSVLHELDRDSSRQGAGARLSAQSHLPYSQCFPDSGCSEPSRSELSGWKIPLALWKRSKERLSAGFLGGSLRAQGCARQLEQSLCRTLSWGKGSSLPGLLQGLVGTSWDPVTSQGNCWTGILSDPRGTAELGSCLSPQELWIWDLPHNPCLVPLASPGAQCCSLPGGICSLGWGGQRFGFAKECSGHGRQGRALPASVKVNNKATATLVVAYLLFICLRPRQINSSHLIFVSCRLFSCDF